MKTKIVKVDNKEYIEFYPEDDMEIFELGQISVRVNENIVNFKHDIKRDCMAMSYAQFPMKKIREALNHG